MQFLSSLLLFLAPISLALPTSVVENALETRQCYTTCGSNCYTSSQVNAAKNSGYNYIKQGGTAGGSSYPHTYNNYEGFDFDVSGPYYEFPLLPGRTYDGGKSTCFDMEIFMRLRMCDRGAGSGSRHLQRRRRLGRRNYAYRCQRERLCWLLGHELDGLMGYA